MHHPTSDEFESLAVDHDFVPVYRRLLSDALTPVTAFRLLDRQAPVDPSDGGPQDGTAGGRSAGGACLFESVIGGEKVGRYSFLAAGPSLRFCATGNDVTVTDLNGRKPTERFQDPDPLNAFRKYFQYSVAQLDELPPFIGGAIGYAAYDVVRYVENLPDAPEDDRQLPDLDFAFYHTLCVFDHVDKTISVVSLADCRKVSNADEAAAAYEQATGNVEATIEKLSHTAPTDAGITPDVWDEAVWRESSKEHPLEITSNFTRESFCQAVRDCVEYIRAGDIFQVVPSQRLAVKTDVDPLEIYRSLRVVNPSPFMFYLRTPDCVLVGCSPEIMCRVQDNVVTVRPLAGTRRRGQTAKEDKALEKELLADPKERAEHVMLVDLGRNDVGRVARFGSIELTEVMVVERYSHVMHISSEVQGTLREGLDAFDALKAVLPAGTVSGAPKVRAMEVIDSIEPHRRGPYAGAVGWIDYRGNMDTCIALRTMVIKDSTVYVQAGCGVVADSDPDAEYEETLNKARALISAIELTVQRLGG
ncbi:anthranilate synthase component I [Roseiconus nitratireducens]|uniref:Anthranilate synthase component 1 n=1 Tax=Roseiconus nitratireducens TaxID=2605748 RepID=A0A5M6D8C5_9BACT|nr:anthranilate synthase component I [Roseiconus nitratireducens]KAA5543767.1 anthranilate synthase component I [Roseiconus nitratireducens]